MPGRMSDELAAGAPVPLNKAFFIARCGLWQSVHSACRFSVLRAPEIDARASVPGPQSTISCASGRRPADRHP